MNQMTFVPPPQGLNFSIDLGFYGTVSHGNRKLMMQEFQQNIKEFDLRIFIGTSKTWKQDM